MRLLIPSLLAAALACAQPAPGVDVAWKIIPRRVAADSFGSRVSKLYYCVVAAVGNNTTYDLQVSSLLFELPPASGINTPVPVDPYRIVRGSLEREHQVGARNSSISIIKALGPILAGGTAFYTGSAYSRLVNLFTNPFEKGFELVFPDKTISQMATLDSLALRDSTIIGSNTQQILIAFVSRDLLKGQVKSRFRAEFDPQAVMHALGDLVLVGKSINYVNRITIKAQNRDRQPAAEIDPYRP